MENGIIAEEADNESKAVSKEMSSDELASEAVEDVADKAMKDPVEELAEKAKPPLALVRGEAVLELPKDLYIPPDALEVILEAFEGPLDLLLYLVKKHNLDILDIPVAEITRQYMEYVELMKAFRLELAGEYLVMAALLGEIKSRCLLPRTETESDDEEADPRAELIRRLQEYEVIKQAASDIDDLPRTQRDTLPVYVMPPAKQAAAPPELKLNELLFALREVLLRADLLESHHIEREALSTRERMSQVLSKLDAETFVLFHGLFPMHEGRLGVVVTFLAILELVKEGLIEIVQAEILGPIHVRGKSGETDTQNVPENSDEVGVIEEVKKQKNNVVPLISLVQDKYDSVDE